MYFVYILQSLKDSGFYVGVTNDVKRRLFQHNAGLSASTKLRKPFKLVRFEEYSSIQTAYKRERFIKSKKSSKIIKKIIGSPDVRL